tara:strand:+ start:408 stop:722 length:315 start_codon:yes stop_codon:yes gene_type:complete
MVLYQIEKNGTFTNVSFDWVMGLSLPFQKLCLIYELEALLKFFEINVMNLGLLFLESISSGVITPEEMLWVTTNQRQFSRIEEATALKLGRLLDSGLIHIGCRI